MNRPRRNLACLAKRKYGREGDRIRCQALGPQAAGDSGRADFCRLSCQRALSCSVRRDGLESRLLARRQDGTERTYSVLLRKAGATPFLKQAAASMSRRTGRVMCRLLSPSVTSPPGNLAPSIHWTAPSISLSAPGRCEEAIGLLTPEASQTGATNPHQPNLLAT